MSRFNLFQAALKQSEVKAKAIAAEFVAMKTSEQYVPFIEKINPMLIKTLQMPHDPPAAYAKGWKGWNDFLGVDPNSPEGIANAQQDQRDKERLTSK